MIGSARRGFALALATILLGAGLSVSLGWPAQAAPGKCVQTSGFGYLTGKKAMPCKRAGGLMRAYIKTYLASNDPNLQPPVPNFTCTRKTVLETADSAGYLKVRCRHNTVPQRRFSFVVGP